MNERGQRVIDLMDTLGHEAPFKILIALGAGERRLGDLILLVARPAETVRAHLERLRIRHLVAFRRLDGVELWRLNDPVVLDFLRMADRLVRMLQTDGAAPYKEFTTSAETLKTGTGSRQ